MLQSLLCGSPFLPLKVCDVVTPYVRGFALTNLVISGIGRATLGSVDIWPVLPALDVDDNDKVIASPFLLKASSRRHVCQWTDGRWYMGSFLGVERVSQCELWCSESYNQPWCGMPTWLAWRSTSFSWPPGVYLFGFCQRKCAEIMLSVRLFRTRFPILFNHQQFSTVLPLGSCTWAGLVYCGLCVPYTLPTAWEKYLSPFSVT